MSAAADGPLREPPTAALRRGGAAPSRSPREAAHGSGGPAGPLATRQEDGGEAEGQTGRGEERKEPVSRAVKLGRKTGAARVGAERGKGAPEARPSCADGRGAKRREW